MLSQAGRGDAGCNGEVVGLVKMIHCPLRPFTDSGRTSPEVREIGDICSAANCTLFDHLIGTREQRGRYFEAERLGGDQVDDELELGRLHHG